MEHFKVLSNFPKSHAHIPNHWDRRYNTSESIAIGWIFFQHCSLESIVVSQMLDMLTVLDLPSLNMKLSEWLAKWMESDNQHPFQLGWPEVGLGSHWPAVSAPLPWKQQAAGFHCYGLCAGYGWIPSGLWSASKPALSFPEIEDYSSFRSEWERHEMKVTSMKLEVSNLPLQREIYDIYIYYVCYDRLHHPNNLLQPIDPIGSSLTTTRWHDGTAEDWTSPFSSTSSPQPPFLGSDTQIVWWDDSIGYKMSRIWIGFWCTRKYYVHVCVYLYIYMIFVYTYIYIRHK